MLVTKEKSHLAMNVGQAKATLKAVEATLNDQNILKQRVETSFKSLDADNSGSLETEEAKKLVADLCFLMHLPPPSEAEFQQHFVALDRNSDGKLSCDEVGSGIVGALMNKANSLKYYLAFAERDQLGDDAALPTQ